MSLLFTVGEEENTSWLQKLRRFCLEFKPLIPAAIVFIAGGMKMGYCIYELPSATYEISTNFLTISWFISVIMGVIISSFSNGHPIATYCHFSSGFLLAVGGICSILMPTTMTATLFSCIFEGTAFGLIQLQKFSTGAEVANKTIRGLLVSTERCFIWFGILLQLTFTYIWYTFEFTTNQSMHVDQMHEIVVACLGITSLICAFTLHVKSPLFLLKQQCSESAVVALRELTRMHSNDLMRMREDYLKLLSVDAGGSCWYIFKKHNLLPLIKLLIMRCFVVLSMSQPFNHLFVSASWLGFDSDMNCLYTLAVAGTLGSIIGGLAVDRYGRRKLCIVTLLPASIFMFITAGINNYLTKSEVLITASDLEIVSILILVYQLIICVGVSTVATVYLTEAFTITQKPKCIAVILIAENLLQILMTIVSFQIILSATALYLVLGIMCLQLGLYVLIDMPETKNLTLYECFLKFQEISLN